MTKMIFSALVVALALSSTACVPKTETAPPPSTSDVPKFEREVVDHTTTQKAATRPKTECESLGLSHMACAAFDCKENAYDAGPSADKQVITTCNEVRPLADSDSDT